MNEENKKLLDEITGLRQSNTSALNIRNAVKMDPEQAARDIDLANKTTLPLDTVQRNRDELQQREYVNSVGNLEGFPAVERFMSDQRNAAVAVDDIENLKLTEKAIQDDIGVWSTFDNWAGGTLNRVNTLTGNFIELVGNMGDEIRDVFDTLGIPNPGIVIGEDGVSFSRDIPRDMPSILTETGKAVSEGQGYDYVPQFTWERLKGDISVRNLSGYVAEQGIQSLPDMVAAMFTLPAYIASRTEEIAEERVANDERKDVELADLGKSLVPALGVSLIERLGAKVTFGKGGVSSPLDALKATGGAAAIEGGTEFVQEGIEYLGETLGTQKEFDTSEMFDRQLAGLVAGSGMAGAIRGTTSTIEALASRTSRRVETNLESLGEQQLIDKIVEYSQSSRLRGRMADRYADFLRGTNSPREVFVTTDGIEAVKQLGVELPQSLTRQDNDLGLDTTMDIATFATEIAGNPELMEVLRPHVRLSSESLSLNEMEQHDLELEKMVERAEQSKELKAEADRIYDEVKDQIVATGRQSEATARYSARIIPAYVTTKAEALGLTPAEVYERMGLKVTGPATELREGQTLDQPTSTFDADKLPEDLRFEYEDLVDDYGPEEGVKQFIERQQETLSYAMDEAINGGNINIAKEQIDSILNAGVPVADEVQFARYNKTLQDAGYSVEVETPNPNEARITANFQEIDYLQNLDTSSMNEFERRKVMNTIDRLFKENEQLQQGSTFNQSSVPDIDRWDMFDYVTGSNDKTYAELMELTKPLIDADERLWSIDALPEYFDTSLLDGIENPSMVYSNSKLLSHVMTESGQVYRVVHSKNEVIPLTEEESQNLTVNLISGVFRDIRNNSPEEQAKQAEQRARLEEERRRDRRIQDAPKLSGDFNADLKTLADYAENFEEFKRLLSADMLDISDRNRTRLARALIALDPDAERASTIMEQQPDMVEDAQRYGTSSEKAAANALNSKNKRVTIFRTMPSGAVIEAGDWVALVKSYAQSHSGNVTEGKVATRQKTISKDDLYWYGADFNEWVYIPSDTWGNYTSLEDVWQDLAGDKPRTYNQSQLGRDAIGMYSAIEKAVTEMNLPGWKSDKGATANEIIQKLKKSPGVKAEELEWSGLEELLKLHDGKLSRDDVLEIARNNRVQVEEIETGERSTGGEFIQPLNLEWRLEGERLVAEFNGVKYEIEKYYDDEFTLFINGDDFELNSLNFEDAKLEAFELADRHRSEYEQPTVQNTGPLQWSDAEIITDPNWYNTEISREEPKVRENALRNVALTLDIPEVDAALRDNDMDELANIIEADYYDDLDLQLDILSQRYTAEKSPDTKYTATRNDQEYWIVEDSEGEFSLYINGVDFELSSRDLDEAKSDAMEIIEHHNEVNNVETPTQWDRYVMPGDVLDYREIKLTLPNIEDQFVNSTHFSEPNILAFMRVTTRPDNQFFIDELQSDWHQQGRQRGYRTPEQMQERQAKNEISAEMDKEVIDLLSQIATLLDPYVNDDIYYEGLTDEEIDALPNQQEFINETGIYDYMVQQIDDAIGLFDPLNEIGSEYMEGLRNLSNSKYATEELKPLVDRVLELSEPFNTNMEQLVDTTTLTPDAPFKGDAWLNLTLKRAIVKAVEEGADSLAWTDSEVMSQRWGDSYRKLYEMQYDKKMVSMVKKLTGVKPELTVEGDQRYWSIPLSQELKDRVASESFPLFQFAGQFSATAPRDQLQRAVAMEDSDISMGTIRRETGWFKGVDNRWRYEISDDKAEFKSDVTDEMRDKHRDRVEREADVSQRAGGLHIAEMRVNDKYVTGQGRSAEAAKNALIDELLRRDGDVLLGGFRGIRGLGGINGTTIGQILNHPELFEAYPFIQDVRVNAIENPESGEFGAFYPDERRIEVNTNRSDAEVLSTLLHEIQHLIQNEEDFAGGGNMSTEFAKAVKDAVAQMSEGSQRAVERWMERNDAKMDDAARAAELAQNALMYKSVVKLMEYANSDKPSSVFRHVRNHVQWIYERTIREDDQLRQRANDIERMFYDIPRRGPKRNAKIGEIAEKTAQLLRDAIPKADLRDFKEDERTLDAMVKALTRDANKAQQPLKPLRGLKREAAAAKVLADATKFKTPYQVYRSLAGEIEARTTQARQNLTPEERQARDPSLDMDTPRNEAIVVMGSLELKIPNVQSSVAPPRGSVTFTPNNEAIIRLGQASDLSTFIHESGHLFLEMEGKFAKEFGITEDQQTILDWLGVESFDDIQVEQHEQFARGFEAYTREGKAPSLALRDAFAAFRRWLLRVYRDITQLNVNLTDDVRGVMDRMLATEREIEEALSAPNYEELFRSKEQAGMTDAEWEKYQKTLEKRRNAATQTIDEKLLKEYTRRKTQEWNEEKAPLVEQERERLSQLPVYQIMSDARQFPMDYDALKEMVGVEKLPGKFIGLAKKDGIDPQEYAETYGYNNVTQMYNAIVDAQPLKKAADEAAEAIMIQKYGDILNDGSIEAEVREAVHNEEQASLLLQELNALKPPRAQAINTQQIKLNARNTISKMKYAEIKPNKYNRAEIRAAQNAARATSKEEQYQYKLQQVVNHHLYREAIAAREAMIKQRKYVRGVQKREYSAKQIAPEYITNMKLIANMYDMRQKPAQTMAIEQVLTWYETQMNDPNDFAQLQLLDVNLIRALAAQQAGELATFELPTFDDLTVEDLQSTYDMLRHLRHVGGQMSDVAKAEFQQEVDVLSASIEQHGGRDVKDRAGLPGKHTDLKRKLSHLINLIPSLRNLMRKLDGFGDGAAYDSIYRRIEDAQNKKLELGVEMFKRFEAELKDIHKIGLSKKDHKTYITDDGMEIDITSEHRFMMALYWGTESSRDAIRDGWNLTDGDVSRILADMTDEQIDLLNAVWKVNESMWPELSAASTRLYGVAPPKLTPTPFSINGKQLSGGHMRLFYDSSELEMKSEQEDAAKMSTIVPSRAGSLYERVGSGGRAPLLDVNNMVRAIEDNVHFIAFAEAGRTVAALMNNNGVKDVMERKHGRGFRKALVQNLENITSNRPAIETLPVIPQVSRLVRHALTMKYLAYSLRNAIQGIPSIKTAMDEVGFTPFVGAFTRFVSPSSHKETVSFVQERSAFMKNRSSVINREASEYLNKVKITGRAGHAWDLFRAYGFTPQTVIDSFIAYPAWIAKYEAAMIDHGDEQRAASQADTAVAESVGSGSDLHLGAAMQQNNTEFVKTMTVFGSWFNNYYQRIYKSTEAFTDFRNRETLQALITTPFVIATLSALLIMDFPDADGDDDEQWGEWMLKRYTGFMAGTVPLLRDINSAFGGFTPKTPLSSVAELPKRLTDEIGAAADDRQTPLKTASDIINLTTTVVPVPGAGNVTRVMNFIDSDMQGNETGSGFEKTYQALVEGPNRN